MNAKMFPLHFPAFNWHVSCTPLHCGWNCGFSSDEEYWILLIARGLITNELTRMPSVHYEQLIFGEWLADWDVKSFAQVYHMVTHWENIIATLFFLHLFFHSQNNQKLINVRYKLHDRSIRFNKLRISETIRSVCQSNAERNIFEFRRCTKCWNCLLVENIDFSHKSNKW